MKKLLLLALCVSLANVATAAEMYRWVDKDGKVHYSDSPPPPTAKKVEEKNLGDNTVVAPGDMPYATRLASKNFPVTLYVTDCGENCTKGREHLAKRGVPYTPKNPSNPADAEALTKLVGSAKVPVLLVGRANPIVGYQAGAWDAALDAAGYPKTKPYGYKEPKLPEAPKQQTPKQDTPPKNDNNS